eukprot:6732501-Alexandrium_andersonii.AAC.1
MEAATGRRIGRRPLPLLQMPRVPGVPAHPLCYVCVSGGLYGARNCTKLVEMPDLLNSFEKFATVPSTFE